MVSVVVATVSLSVGRLGGSTDDLLSLNVKVLGDLTITGIAIINLGIVVVHGEVEAKGPESVALETNVKGGTNGKKAKSELTDDKGDVIEVLNVPNKSLGDNNASVAVGLITLVIIVVAVLSVD